ncbi:hypothetical protein W822_08975 [Advenella kashmirensis W13003]|uniref:Calcineurin-like phosphoesterase domain-containing protein n=1 Tax=Advenella kashmirensis W13003 TaxID=1424334 RepID=V8QWU9_9BURK|nr:metallophosphoesterase [Advenella kashmirensis]ETF03484.1 hypothetical protein W822_08975 [Advenella kashmirensis W13003]
MKIRILSDIHIEFFPFDIPRLPDDLETVLVLAGDIGVVADQKPLQSFLQLAATQFKAVVMVFGNHEYYRSVWPDALHDLRRWTLPDNFHVLEKSSIEIDDVVFLGATLWSDFENENPLSMMHCQRYINDFRMIGTHAKAGPYRPFSDTDCFSPKDALEEHRASCRWMADCMAEIGAAGRKMVIVTHHGVAPHSVNQKFIGSPTNGAFVSDLSELLMAGRPRLVIHGHVHDSVDYTLGDSGHPIRVIANPRGYTKKKNTQENKCFDPMLAIEV